MQPLVRRYLGQAFADIDEATPTGTPTGGAAANRARGGAGRASGDDPASVFAQRVRQRRVAQKDRVERMAQDILRASEDMLVETDNLLEAQGGGGMGSATGYGGQQQQQQQRAPMSPGALSALSGAYASASEALPGFGEFGA